MGNCINKRELFISATQKLPKKLMNKISEHYLDQISLTLLYIIFTTLSSYYETKMKNH